MQDLQQLLMLATMSEVCDLLQPYDNLFTEVF